MSLIHPPREMDYLLLPVDLPESERMQAKKSIILSTLVLVC